MFPSKSFIGLYIVPNEVIGSKAFIQDSLGPSCGSFVVGPPVEKFPCIGLEAGAMKDPGALEAATGPETGESSALSEVSNVVEAGVGIRGMLPCPVCSALSGCKFASLSPP